VCASASSRSPPIPDPASTRPVGTTIERTVERSLHPCASTNLSATDQFCYFCSQWGGVEQIDLVTTANQMKTFSVSNGGGLQFLDWSFTYGPQVRSISGPFLSPVTGNQRRNTLVMMSNGDLWDMDPVLTSGTPSWAFRLIGTF
jgi:hypothetical protein